MSYLSAMPRRRRSLGDSSSLYASYNPALWVASDVAPPLDTSTPALPSSLVNYPAPIPTVSPQTLLAAAALPGAPASVVQAAAQYQAAGGSQWISGISNTWILIGGGALVFLLLLMGKRR